jgi:hypothetical protein
MTLSVLKNAATPIVPVIVTGQNLKIVPGKIGGR